RITGSFHHMNNIDSRAIPINSGPPDRSSQRSGQMLVTGFAAYSRVNHHDTAFAPFPPSMHSRFFTV
ncbi:hypothetical protein QP932_12115, partial [Corynebacterium freneyi]|uniref:hypothetical protein n=1 Tax=Corynebacterium freneyi TaxID=134034 RepID=UPI00254A71B4